MHHTRSLRTTPISFSLIFLVASLLLAPLFSVASVVMPTGCVAVGTWRVTDNTFRAESIVPDPREEEMVSVDACEEIATRFATEVVAVGETVSPDSDALTTFPDTTGIIMVPLEEGSGSLGADGESYGGGLRFGWPNATSVSPDDWLVQWQANGMISGLMVHVTTEYVSVVQQEGSVVQCSATYALSEEEQRELEEAVAALPLQQLESLERPSCDACFDGDLGATLWVTHEGVNYTSSSFDLNNPPASLAAVTAFVGSRAQEVCPSLPLQDTPSVLPDEEPGPAPEPSPVPEEETRGIQQRIIELLQEVLRLLQLR